MTVQSEAGRHRNRLALAMLLSLSIFAVELVAGIAANSAALVADAAHVFADVSGMALAIGAIWVASRRVTASRSFGLYRLEILAATVNALLLFAVSGFVIVEGVRRLAEPPEINATLMIIVAALALAANAASLALLRDGQASLTIRGAYLEILGDFLGAGAVLVAGILVLAFGLIGADAVASILIGVLILPRTWALLRDSIDVLLEATPKGVDLAEVKRHILEAPGVGNVHDLHAWTITSGMNVVSAHVVVAPDANPGAILDHLGMCLSQDFDTDHSTFQLETEEHVLWEGRAAQVKH